MTRVFAFCGKMGSGKSTACQFIKEGIEREVGIIKFAEPLYDIQNSVYDICGLKQPETKDRKLLQWIGTEWGREKDINLWTNIWKRGVKYYLEQSPTAIVLCDDLRFPNELEALREFGGKVIKIESSIDERSKRINLEGSSHSTEAFTEGANADFTIINNGHIVEFKTKLQELIWELDL